MSGPATAARDTELTTLRRVFDLLQDAVILADGSGRIRFANEASAHLFGYTPAALLGCSLNELIPARHRDAHENSVREFTRSGRSRLMGNGPILHALRRSGEEIPVSISLCSVDVDGKRLAVAIIRNLTGIASQIDAVRALAETDSLTGLGNRLHLSARLTGLIETAASRFALLYLDLDGFKAVNDQHGHECGDRVLKIVAARLKASVRDCDVVVRVGGDEFVVLLSDVTEDADVEQIAAKLGLAVGQRFNARGVRGAIGISIGWALFPRDGHTESELLRVADTRMYRQKAARLEYKRNMHEPGLDDHSTDQ
jgi:diguanylate cyclase (GGDEF)-like protein/PAS domain S-box-containing protein